MREESAEKNGIMSWPLRNCSICGYTLSYYFDDGTVTFDSGYNCVSGPPRITKESWKCIATHYNMQTSKEYIAKMDEFWKF